MRIVKCEVLSTSRGEIAFRMNGKVWVIAFVGKEQGDTSSRTWSVVACEFSKRK